MGGSFDSCPLTSRPCQGHAFFSKLYLENKISMCASD